MLCDNHFLLSRENKKWKLLLLVQNYWFNSILTQMVAILDKVVLILLISALYILFDKGKGNL